MNEKDAIRLAALRYSLHPLIAKNLAQLCIFLFIYILFIRCLKHFSELNMSESVFFSLKKDIPKNMQQNHGSKVWFETVSSKAKVMHFKVR